MAVDDEFRKLSALAAAAAEAMNVAAMVQRGDDAAWHGIGGEPQLQAAREVRRFAGLVEGLGRVGAEAMPGTDLPAAAEHARRLADDLAIGTLPVSERARRIAFQMLCCLGVPRETLDERVGELATD